MPQPNHNAEYFAQVIAKYKKQMLASRDTVGKIAVDLFNDGFTKQGQIMANGKVKPWKPRKSTSPKAGKHPILIKRGHLRRASKYVKKGRNIVELRNHKPYAIYHNEGGKYLPKRPIFYYTPELPRRLDVYFKKAVQDLLK